MEYSSDYNKWVGSFVVQSIAWQDEGLPGDFVTQRLRNGSFVDIEDSKLDTNQNKAVVILKRDSEARTILMGLSLFDYYKNWEFENAPYYQMVLINWVEKNKQTFIDNLFGDSVGEKEHPVITWCVAAEYIQGLINGISFEGMSEEQLLHQIMLENSSKNTLERKNKEWKDVLTYLTNQASMRGTVRNSLVSGSNTIMGIVGDTVSGKVQFYRTYELCNSLRHLESKGWDISGELTDYNSKAYENIRSYLQGLYTKVAAIVTSEKKLAKETIKSFEDLLGSEIASHPSEVSSSSVYFILGKFTVLFVTCYVVTEVKQRKHPCFLFIILNHCRQGFVFGDHCADPTSHPAATARWSTAFNYKRTFVICGCSSIHCKKIFVRVSPRILMLHKELPNH